jgi:hypothetical protein
VLEAESQKKDKALARLNLDQKEAIVGIPPDRSSSLCHR